MAFASVPGVSNRQQFSLAIALLLFAFLVPMQTRLSAEPIVLDLDCDFPFAGNGIHAVVREVIEGGLGDQLGIGVGEAIVMLDDRPIPSKNELARRLQAGPPLKLHVRNPTTGGMRVVRIGADDGAVGANGDQGAVPIVPNQGEYYRLTNAFLGTGQSLVADDRGSVSMAVNRNDRNQFWMSVPAGGDRYRLSNVFLGTEWSLSANHGRPFPTLERTNRDSLQQLWTIDFVGNSDCYIVQEFEDEEWALGASGSGGVFVSRRRNTNDQLWTAKQYAPDGAVGGVQAKADPLRPRLISSKTITGPPLEPANIEFVNTCENELLVIVAHPEHPNGALELQIPAGQSEVVEMDRASTRTAIEVWEIPLQSGGVYLDNRKTSLPPKANYRVSVYEMAVMSLSFDATKKGRPKLEEEGRSPKSVGVFQVPSGPDLHDGKYDAFEVAKKQNNSGAVQKIDPGAWQTDDSAEFDQFQRTLRRARQ